MGKGYEKTGNPVGRPRAFQTVKELNDKIKEYIDLWDEQNRPLTMAGLQCYLDVYDETYRNYAQGKYDSEDQNFSSTLKKARKFIENSKLEGALTGKYIASVAIFDLKNNHGYADRIESKNTNRQVDKDGEDVHPNDIAVLKALGIPLNGMKTEESPSDD